LEQELLLRLIADLVVEEDDLDATALKLFDEKDLISIFASQTVGRVDVEAVDQPGGRLIARKVSCGNKTEAGKRSFEVLRSVATSCLKRGHDVVSYLAGLLPFGARADPVPEAVSTPGKCLSDNPPRPYRS
jgi:hypothetical protein